MGLYKTLKRAVPVEWKVAILQPRYLAENFALRLGNAFRSQPAIPPARLIYLVSASRSAGYFLESGRSSCEAIRRILNKNDLALEQFEAVLDFGCGVGRIMRHWRETQGPAWHGTDYNPELVAWCKRNLKFAEFRVNTLSGELPYEAETFDFIYAFSVFTHLSEPLQFFWINELWRVLRPGGYVYFTTHGEHYLSYLNEQEREQFRGGQLLVKAGEESGSNVCSTFHPVSWVHERLAQNFNVIDFVAGGAQGDSLHDVHLLRKPL